MGQEKEIPDAGLRSLDHYKNILPQWRYYVREMLLPIVRWETPFVAMLQDKLRSPALDSYFATSANLGTHTFYMIMLPILFWCGYSNIGRGMTHVLALGVLFSGFIKDLLCLPRPLSPPLRRITMSGSAALEYGFPSTHSTNAVSVAIYALSLLERQANNEPTTSTLLLRGMSYFFAFSIVLGRLYCGMHGFFDVIWGSALGAVLGYVQCVYGAWFDAWLHEGDFTRVLTIISIILVFVRIHPEPADDCPCFDDSLAFAGTLMGISIGGWHFSRTSYSWSDPIPGTVPFNFKHMGLLVTVLRIVLGVFIVFAWRGVMKPMLLKFLPPVFRVVEHYGLTLPRRFFLPASQYETVPKQKNDGDIIPSAAEIPGLLSSFRKRAVSIGPQSEADAYEALALREKRRHDVVDVMQPPDPTVTSDDGVHQHPGSKTDTKTKLSNRRRSLSIDEFRAQMGMGGEMFSRKNATLSQSSMMLDANIGRESPPREIPPGVVFARVTRPRVKYDVEVVTKLIVYTGIGWLAVEGSPIIFQLVGLGMK